jgi:uncharacterized protein YjiS (DUF1127 family)
MPDPFAPTLLQCLSQRWHAALRRRAERRQLLAMSERELLDLALGRGELEACAAAPQWRHDEPAHLLRPRRV